MRILMTLILAVSMMMPAFAQEAYDPQAKKILEKISTTTQNYQSLRASFVWTLENKAEKTKDSKNGYMFLKGGKYKLILQGTEIFSDGQTTWTYSKDANEITISSVDEDDESIVSNPTKIFDLYKSGFKYALKGEAEIQDPKTSAKKKCHVIDLYPENPKGKEFHTVQLLIDKSNDQIVCIDIKFKNGSDQIIEINEYKPDVTMPDNLFIYEESKYPGAEVNDMR